MIALYSVGNVKRELKKIGRKLYIRDFAKFIFAYIEEDKLSLLTVQKITDDRWQIIHFYAGKIQKNNEYINFYQEILYRFYKEQEQHLGRNRRSYIRGVHCMQSGIGESVF